MTAIAILGSGRVGASLATAFAAAGHDVVVGSRDPEAATAAWKGDPPRITTVTEAVEAAGVVVNATPGESSLERLSALAGELSGSILIDVTNATRRDGDAPGELLYPGSSLAERLQDALPATQVVKTLNTMLFMVMGAPSLLSAPPTAFLSGDDDGAKATVRGLLGDIGWPDTQVLDLGDIRTARGPEAAILLVPDIMRARGFAPFAITVVS